MKPLRTALVALCCTAACAVPDRSRGPEAVSDATPEVVEGPLVDTHLHLRTAAAARLVDRVGAVGAEEALAALDRAGVERGLVLSLAYLFGDPDLNSPDEAESVRRENDFVAAEVARAPERLTGACSVNPLAPYALDEVGRCLDGLGMRWVKLHFTNSGVDLTDGEHVARLSELFGLLERSGAGAVVHLRTRSDSYGAADARAFIDRVLALAPEVPVQIAHMGGWGGYDDATDDVMGAFVSALERGRLRRDSIWFGLGAVVFLPEAAGADSGLRSSIESANRRLAERIRQVGIDRVTYATDWPSWPPVADPVDGIAANIDLLRTALPLSDEEIRALFSSPGPLGAQAPGSERRGR